MQQASIVLVTPALAEANNGNWQTAQRWARMLGRAYRVTLQSRYGGEPAALMIALHARRSAAALRAWRAAHPGAPLLLVLTGTDLYRDIAVDAEAQAALQMADRLVVLNELGVRALPPPLRHKARVVLQSCAARQPLEAKPKGLLRALMVGHLRAEKDPACGWQALALLRGRPDIRLDHIGAALDPALGAAATALSAQDARYRWLGPLPHAEVRRRIQHAHVLLHPSRMEGGAHVVIEALRSGTAVLASHIDGNVGLLGAGHPGLFKPGDAAALAALLTRCRDGPGILATLRAAGDTLAPKFAPEAESAALLGIVDELLNGVTP
jgi:putative glycosyltransferase (TIGR04348 family)